MTDSMQRTTSIGDLQTAGIEDLAQIMRMLMICSGTMQKTMFHNLLEGPSRFKKVE